MSLQLISPSFGHGEEIPARHTCDGLNVSPALSWTGVPQACKSLVLVVDDPDAPDPAAPKMTWVHWLLYNISAKVSGLSEGIEKRGLPGGTLPGLNDWHSSGYGGPCPPAGRHRYFFKLYALDTVLTDMHMPTKSHLEKAMHGHALDQSSLIGMYQRHGK